MRVTVNIDVDTALAAKEDRVDTAKQLRALADIVDPYPKRVREVAETPYYAGESEGPEGKTPSDEAPLRERTRADLIARIDALEGRMTKQEQRPYHPNTRTLADHGERIDKLEQRADKQVSEHCDLAKTLDARMRERAESLHDITTEIGKRVTVVEDKVTNLAGAGTAAEATYRPGITPAPDRTDLQREIEQVVNHWRKAYNRQFLVVSQPYHKVGEGTPRNTVHCSDEPFAGTELPDGSTITKGLAGA